MRRKIEIELIGEKSRRHTTFTKRRKGLQKKTEEYCRISDSTAVIIAFSNANNCYLFGHPEVEAVLDHYYETSSCCSEAGTFAAVEEAPAPASEAEERIAYAVESGRWEEAMRGLGPDELDRFSAVLENIGRRVSAAAALKGKGRILEIFAGDVGI